MALDTMRRFLAPDEDTSVGAMDATTPEEADAALAGVSVPEGRDLAKPEKGPMAALDRATFAARNPIGPPAPKESDLTSPIPVARPAAQDGFDAVPGVIKTAMPAVDAANPAGKAGQPTDTLKPPKPPVGAGGDMDEMNRLGLGQALVRALEGSGSIIAGRDLRSGAADTLGERMKQIEALRAKKAERQEGLEVERSQNEQTLNAYQAQFPELRETLEPLRGQTGKPAFSGLLRDIVAAQRAKTGERALDIREKGMQDTAGYRAGTLGLRKDTLEANNQWRAVQAGLKKTELDLRKAEGERKASGSAEPSPKERSTFQAMMKPAENTAVALKDAANLDAISGGMLSTGKPPPFLTRAAIAQFNLGEAARGELARSNPEAFDLLTEMARLKTMVGHEYFGSALSPSEAERQRQFLDFGMMDSPESVATKMKNYRSGLANKASVFLRPRVVNHPLGAEWAQMSGLDALSAEGGTFAGLLEVPKTAVKASATTGAAPAEKTPPPMAAVDYLKKNPDQAAAFDLKYGAGSAAEYLGGGR